MSKELLMEKLTELSKSRSVDRDIMRTVVDMFSMYSDALEASLQPFLSNSPSVKGAEFVANELNAIMTQIEELKILNSIGAEIKNELHIMRNDLDALTKDVDLIKKANTPITHLQKDIDKLGKEMVDIENKLNKLVAKNEAGSPM